MINRYSELWFKLFLNNKSAAETESEVSFLMRQLPISDYKSILDLCCGNGRHANALARNGYDVIGIDKNINALNMAEKSATANVRFIRQDMRDISALPQSFDAVICMWQSFGYFGEAENNNILMQIYKALNPQGRFILDIYNKSFFENHIGMREIEKQGIKITEEIEKQGDRFAVKVSYGNTGIVDEFNWRLYAEDEMISVCEKCDFICRAACAWCTENMPVTNSSPRMQLVFQKKL